MLVQSMGKAGEGSKRCDWSEARSYGTLQAWGYKHTCIGAMQGGGTASALVQERKRLLDQLEGGQGKLAWL